MSSKYDHNKIELKWQERWGKDQIYVADIDSVNDPKKRFYNLWMFPYPSAEGLHAGHAFASTGSDIQGRFQRMNGKEVFQPIGYDSFGIHSENYAIKINQNPQEVVLRTTKHYEEQMRSLGHGYDWTRTVTTSSPDYYKWTQWLFTEMFRSGLVYKKKAQVNFCPSCKTVLADEQVMSPKQAGKEPKDANGNVIQDASEDIKVCERCGTVVEKRDLDQWFCRITDYADRLLEGLGKIDWSERVVKAQREWIGRKEGVQVDHKVKGIDLILTAFSAYPAWLFADTFLVIAPEHKLVPELVRGTEYEKDVLKFVEAFKNKKSGKGKKLDEKEGIFTGRYALDPLTGREFPIWLANFALVEFGTGIIRCSAHDPRDYEFANKYQIHLEEVVERTDKDGPVNAHLNSGELYNSGEFSGRTIDKMLISEIVGWIEKNNFGRRSVNYHLRDWLVSRQRYWGAPIPMIYCEECSKKGIGYLSENEPVIHKDYTDWSWAGWWVDESLPVILPPMKEYKPEGTGKGPLSHHPEFYEVKCPHCGSKAERETDVMDTFVDSSWYFLRYPSVRSESSTKLPFDPKISKVWLPVDLYFGGAEHSVLHLMYARFVNMVMYDRGLLDHEEPFPKFFAHGLMIKDGAKMSKSRGNVVNPDEYVAKYGADTMRMYLMFMGPMDGYPDFRDTGIEGMHKFLGRLWRIFTQKPVTGMPDKAMAALHRTIKGVSEDIQSFKYNTAMAKIMELTNVYSELNISDPKLIEPLVLLVAPFAPHLAEEIWVEYLRKPFSIHKAKWPSYEVKHLVDQELKIIIQVNGKVRGEIVTDPETAKNENQISLLASKDEKVSLYLKDLNIKKTVFVPGKIINFVT